jgi:aminoglycoside phosphotransferase (APT) family kinase protein
MSLMNLQHRLHEKGFLKRLLQADKHQFDPPGDLRDIQWEVLPYYLPSTRPRITFHLYTKEGEYLLKLNTEIHKIHREAAACQLLYSLNIPELSVPLVYAVKTQVPLSQNQFCAWLITEWVSGIPADRAADEVLVKLLPSGLLNFHRHPVNDLAVERIFGRQMPRHSKAQEILRDRRREYFEHALEVCTQKLVQSVSQLEDMVCTHPFTGHLAFIHGDFHINNIKYYKVPYKDGHRLFLFDWEDISVDHPLYDLANLIFSDGFSERSQKCLETYVSFYNQKQTEHGPLNLMDAWMLTIICFVRNLRWNLSVFHKEQQMLEREAEQTIEKIICTMNKKQSN